MTDFATTTDGAIVPQDLLAVEQPRALGFNKCNKPTTWSLWRHAEIHTTSAGFKR
jgi:hypothetical protein